MTAHAAEVAAVQLGSTSTEVVVARQPIVDRAGAVQGYELLYRQAPGASAAESGDQMTADVLLSALSIGVAEIVGQHLLFCNATRSTLTGVLPITLPPDRTVVEVLEDIELDDAVVDGCRALVERGYRLALDDFVWVARAEELLELATFVKIDVLALDWDEVATLVERCSAYEVVLVAEKIEHPDDVERAAALGFTLFQGYAIDRPQLSRGRTVSASAVARVRLAATVLTDELDLEELEQVVRREPGLVVQLLNLASIGPRRELRRAVRTVREALVLLGTERTRQWLALTLLGANRSGPNGDALATALVRARTCEQLARSRRTAPPEEAFTAGLLSALDLLLGVPQDELADHLQLDEQLMATAFDLEDDAGRLVSDVLVHERAVTRRTGELDPAADAGDDVAACYAAAFAWTVPYLGTVAPVD